MMPTVPRGSGVSYVEKAAEAVMRQMESAPDSGAQFVIYQPRVDAPGQAASTVVANLNGIIGSMPSIKGLVSVVSEPPNKQDPPLPPGFVFKQDLSPGPVARQQTRDVVSMLKHAMTKCGPGKVRQVLLLEDDFVFCERGLELLAHALNRLQFRNKDFATLRVGYGMNGVVMRCEDLQGTAAYLLDQQVMMPVDLLSDEWHMRSTVKGQTQFKPNQQAYFLRYNLLNHIGSVSNFKGRAERPGLACGANLALINSFVPGTSFDETKCRNDDISPCNGRDQPGVPPPILDYSRPPAPAPYKFPAT